MAHHKRFVIWGVLGIVERSCFQRIEQLKAMDETLLRHQALAFLSVGGRICLR